MNIQNSEQFVKIADGSFKPLNEKFYGTGITVVYKCKPGYYTKRFKATQAVCQQDGKWNFANLAKCREGCRLSDAPEIHNARLVGSGNRHLSSKGRDKFYDINGAAHFLCKSGHKAINKRGRLGRSPTIRCTSQGWTEPKTECVKNNNRYRYGRRQG